MAFKDHFKKFPIINAERIILRPFSKDDFADYQEWYEQDPMRASYLLPESEFSYDKFVYFFEYIAVRLLNGKHAIIWCIELKDINKCIGTIELGDFQPRSRTYEDTSMGQQCKFVLNKAYQGNGYVTEAVNAVAEYGFNTLGLLKISSKVPEIYTKAIDILKKCNYEIEGVRRKEYWDGEAYRDIVHFARYKY